MIIIRPATVDDRDFVIETARRFAAFGPPPWRTPHEIVAGEVRCLDDFFDALIAGGIGDQENLFSRKPKISSSPDPHAIGGMQGSTLLIAEDAGHPIGFAFLEHHTDYFTGERHGHLGMIAVTEAAEGRGAGAALLRAAEDWTREQGYAKLTLNVFEGNARARRAYERAGFQVETLRYVKGL